MGYGTKLPGDTLGAAEVNAIIDLQSKGEKTAYENLTAGDLVRIFNDAGSAKFKKIVGWGDLNQWLAAGASSNDILDVIKLADDKIVVSYSKDTAATGPNNDPYYVICGTISNNAITWGSALLVFTYSTSNGAPGSLTKLARLDDTHFIGVASGTTYNYGNPWCKLYLFSVSGTTITNQDNTDMGQAVADSSGGFKFAFRGIAVVSSSKVVLVGYESGTGGSGNTEAFCDTITGGTTFDDDYSTQFTVATGNDYVYGHQIDTDRILFHYGTNTRVATLSGTAFTNVATDTLTYSVVDGPHSFVKTATGEGYFVTLTGANTGILKITESAGSITEDAYLVLNTSTASQQRIDLYGSQDNTAIVQYNDKLRVVNYDDTAGQFSADDEYDPNNMSNMIMCVTSDEQVSCIGFISSNYNDHTGSMDFQKLMGLIKSTVTAGNTAVARSINGAVDDNQSNRVINTKYYMAPDGTITPLATQTFNGVTVTNKLIGTAISATEIMLQLN